MSDTVVGMLKTMTDAKAVVARLKEGGFSSDVISILSSEAERAPDAPGVADTYSSKASEGALAGASAGGIGGWTLGALLGAGLVAIPGPGPLMAVGPILAALSGFAAGAAVGGVAGALIGMGVPELHAHRYAGRIVTGHVLISIHTRSLDERAKAERILETEGAEDIYSSTRSAST